MFCEPLSRPVLLGDSCSFLNFLSCSTNVVVTDDKPHPKSLKNADGLPHPTAGKKDVVWFALDKSRPLFSFAGVWTDLERARDTKANPTEDKHLIYEFLTCELNACERARAREGDAGYPNNRRRT